MKSWKTFIGVFCILFAVFGILDISGAVAPLTGIAGEVSLLRVTVGLLLISLAVISIIKLQVIPAVLLFSLLFMVFEKNIAILCGLEQHNIINNWILLLFTLLLCTGLGFILPSGSNAIFMLPKHVSSKGGMNSNSIYIDSSTFTDRHVENNMGSTIIKFENADSYPGGGVLNIENNLGSMVIHIPEGWRIDCNIENNLGSINNRVAVGGNGPTLNIVGENNLGSVVIDNL